MGETLQPVTPRFNRSLRIESREDRLTGDPGAVLLREILESSGIVAWLGERLTDPRRQADVVHDLPSLPRTAVLLAAQGWRDHDDADALRHDPAMRLATSSSAGLTPLLAEPGLASQPTLSRFTAMMTEPGNLKALRDGVLELVRGGCGHITTAGACPGSRSTSIACRSRVSRRAPLVRARRRTVISRRPNGMDTTTRASTTRLSPRSPRPATCSTRACGREMSARPKARST